MLSLIESNIKIHDEADLVQSAFNVAADHSLTTYDSVYLALAKKLDGSIASRDRKQVEAARTLEIETVST
jgi:predicted nucleic acid-binding protein